MTTSHPIRENTFVSETLPSGSQSSLPAWETDFWRSIDHNLHLSSMLSHPERWNSMRKQIQEYLQRPALLPEEYLESSCSFFLWDAVRLQDYENYCWEHGWRPMTRVDYVQHFLVHAENPADFILLLWDQQDVSFYPTLDGRPSDGFLDGKISGFPNISTIRAERWEFLFRCVSPENWLKPLHPVNGQVPGQTLWDRFRQGTDPKHESNPSWRLHVWTRLVLCYREVMPFPLHPWHSRLCSLPLEWPFMDPDPLVHNSVPWLQKLIDQT